MAFKLAWALSQRACGSERVTPRYRDFLLDSLTLAALGTVADMVPLQDENRLFVRHGLARVSSVLRVGSGEWGVGSRQGGLAENGSTPHSALRTPHSLNAPWVGLKALFDVAGLSDKSELGTTDIGYRLAPRLNAAGRLGGARLVVELLTTNLQPRAVDLARFLEGQNQQRQQLEQEVFAQARELAENEGLDGKPALVLANAEWHGGIIGIVAGRLAELYARPVFLSPCGASVANARAIGQGSGRSVPGFPLHEALRACEQHLISHGGHAAAAGLKIAFEQIEAFRESFCVYASQIFSTRATETPVGDRCRGAAQRANPWPGQ